MEVIVSPESSAGKDMPRLLTNGFNAIRTAWRRTTIRSVSPLDRAVVTKGWPSMSSRLPLMTRIVAAVPAVPMTMMGIHRFFARSRAFAKLHGASS